MITLTEAVLQKRIFSSSVKCFISIKYYNLFIAFNDISLTKTFISLLYNRYMV